MKIQAQILSTQNAKSTRIDLLTCRSGEFRWMIVGCRCKSEILNTRRDQTGFLACMTA